MKFLRKFAALIFVLFLTSCVETIVLGTLAGGVAITQEKKFSETVSDSVIESKILFQLTKVGLKTPRNSVEIVVNRGRVLLVGILRDQSKAGLASDIAWKVDGVKEVIDEIQISDNRSLELHDFAGLMRDYFISLQVESRLLLAQDLASVNYKITTINGSVYLIGIASDELELRKVLSVSARVRGVKKIVNHITLANDEKRQ